MRYPRADMDRRLTSPISSDWSVLDGKRNLDSGAVDGSPRVMHPVSNSHQNNSKYETNLPKYRVKKFCELTPGLVGHHHLSSRQLGESCDGCGHSLMRVIPVL